jgi:uncharacterized membrane protein
MLQLAPLFLAILPAQVQVEVVRLPSDGGAIGSADGSWAAGCLVGGQGEPAGAFRWSSESGLERLPGTAWGLGISDDGQTVLVHVENAAGKKEVALWTPLGIQVLPGLGAALPTFPFGKALSRDGDFAVGVAAKPNWPVNPLLRAVRWASSGEVLELETPGNDDSTAQDLSDDGRVVVGAIYSDAWPYSKAALWLDGNLHVLQSGGEAFGTSSDGAFVTGWDGTEPWLWHRSQGMLTLDVLPPRPFLNFFEASQAVRVSDDGGIVLCAQLYSFAQTTLYGRSYLWTPGAGAVDARELFEALGAHELTAFDRIMVSSLSSDGRVLVGTGFNYGPPMETLLWRAVLPPAAEVYCTAQTSSGGCTPAIGFSGTPSARTGAGFQITASGVPAAARAMLVYGTSGAASVPFGGGLLCVAQPFARALAEPAAGGEACEGALALDFNALVAQSGGPALVGGAQVWTQLWIRDDGAPPPHVLLTDALTFTLWP